MEPVYNENFYSFGWFLWELMRHNKLVCNDNSLGGKFIYNGEVDSEVLDW